MQPEPNATMPARSFEPQAEQGERMEASASQALGGAKLDPPPAPPPGGLEPTPPPTPGPVRFQVNAWL